MLKIQEFSQLDLDIDAHVLDEIGVGRCWWSLVDCCGDLF
jgi:hypothetical protein